MGYTARAFSMMESRSSVAVRELDGAGTGVEDSLSC